MGGGWLQRQLDHPSKAFYSSNAGSVFFTRHLHLNNDSSGQIASQFSCFPAEDQGLPPLKDFSDVTIRFILSACGRLSMCNNLFPAQHAHLCRHLPAQLAGNGRGRGGLLFVAAGLPNIRLAAGKRECTARQHLLVCWRTFEMFCRASACMHLHIRVLYFVNKHTRIFFNLHPRLHSLLSHSCRSFHRLSRTLQYQPGFPTKDTTLIYSLDYGFLPTQVFLFTADVVKLVPVPPTSHSAIISLGLLLNGCRLPGGTVADENGTLRVSMLPEVFLVVSFLYFCVLAWLNLRF